VGGRSATEGTTIEAGFYRHLVRATVLTCDRNYPYPYSDGHRGAARSYDDSGRCCPSSPLRHDDDTRTSFWHAFQELSPLPRHIQRSHSPATGAPDPPPAAVLPPSQPSWGCPALHGRGIWPCPNCHNVNWAKRDTWNTRATRPASICSNLRGRERAGGGDTWSERRLQRSNSTTKKRSTTSLAGRKKKSAGTRPYYGH